MALFLKYWKFAALGLMAIVLAVGLMYVKALRSDNARLAESARQSQAAAARLAEDLEANRLALEQRQAETARLAEEKREAITALEKVYENDEEACDWGAGVIPDGVYSRLCE
jgi:uncharacterized membrane protein